MPKLLVVEVSPRFESSVSRALTADFVEKWRSANPGGEVVVRDLPKSKLPYVDLQWIGGAFSPPEHHTEEHTAAIKVSDDLIAEIVAADHVVIGTPMYNFSIPALLKAYLDQIVRQGVTVSNTYEGMLTGRAATILLATGGDFSAGAPYAAANVADSYLRQVLGFIGIKDVEVVLAVCTRAVDEGHVTISEFVADHAAAIDLAVAQSAEVLAA